MVRNWWSIKDRGLEIGTRLEIDTGLEVERVLEIYRGLEIEDKILTEG